MLTGNAGTARRRAELRTQKAQLAKFQATLSRLRHGIDDDENNLSAIDGTSPIETDQDDSHTLGEPLDTLEGSESSDSEVEVTEPESQKLPAKRASIVAQIGEV